MARFYENLNIDFLKETWYYKVNYLGYAFVMSSDNLERHYIFETHGDKYDLYIDTEGTLNCSEYKKLENDFYSAFYIVDDTKLERLSFEEFTENKKKNAIKKLVSKFCVDEDSLDDMLIIENIAAFDKVLVVYKENGLLCEPYFGVNVIDIEAKRVSEEEFYNHISKF